MPYLYQSNYQPKQSVAIKLATKQTNSLLLPKVKNIYKTFMDNLKCEHQMVYPLSLTLCILLFVYLSVKLSGGNLVIVVPIGFYKFGLIHVCKNNKVINKIMFELPTFQIW